MSCIRPRSALVTSSTDQPSESVELALAWWEYQLRTIGSQDERKALELGQPEHVVTAKAVVDHVIQRGGATALDLVVALVDNAPAASSGVAVGAGPLEDLLHEHGDDIIDQVERLARQHRPFADALAVVSIERGHLGSDTENRLRPWIGRFTRSQWRPGRPS